MPFFEKRDYNFFQSINNELIDDFIETPVIIFRLDVQQSETNIYGESVGGKTYMTGLKINCLIDREDQLTNYEGFGSDVRQGIQFRFLRKTLELAEFRPSVGDVIRFNDMHFEIGGIIDNQLVAGRPEFKHSLLCNTSILRNSKINFEELI
jgi:hypothetical protein